MDTLPVKKGGCLPGVLLITPTDGDDASAKREAAPLSGCSA